MLWLALIATIIGLVLFIVGCFWSVRAQGQFKTREGPEIYAELISDNARHDARLEGKRVLASKTWAAGYGKAVSGAASISWEQMIGAWRQRDWLLLKPWFTIALGGVILIVFGGLTALLAGGGARVFGVAIWVMGAVIGWKFRSFCLAARDRMDQLTGAKDSS